MEEQFYRALIASLIEERHRQGITQERLCQIIGVSDGLVNKWESGVRLPSLFYFMCWCASLGLQLKTERTDGIENLELQPNYAIRLNNHPITTYRADFRYAVLDERGRVEKLVVEDVKGMITDVYALKKKLFEAAYEIKINEIPASKVEQWKLTIP